MRKLNIRGTPSFFLTMAAFLERVNRPFSLPKVKVSLFRLVEDSFFCCLPFSSFPFLPEVRTMPA